MEKDVARFVKSLSPLDIGRILFRRLMEVEPAIAATCPKMNSQSAGRMGFSTREVGDLVRKALCAPANRPPALDSASCASGVIG